MTRMLSRRQLFTFDLVGGVACTSHWVRVHRQAMACRLEVTLSSDAVRHVAAARAALDEADRIEAALTVFRNTSELMRVNRLAASRPVAIDDRLFALLTMSQQLSYATGGAFDITSTPLSRCWGFLRREGQVPATADIDGARSVVGANLVELDANAWTVHFAREGVELNLGSIGKGYALDRMAAMLREAGVTDALVSAGGSSVLAVGGAGGGWTIDIKSRQVRRDRLARLRITNAALATSGAGEQFVEVDGVRYGHVIDPRTGWPARGVLSVSVVADEAAVADALSTAFLVGGPALAKQYCASHPETLVLMTLDDGTECPLMFGSHRGVTMEDARLKARATPALEEHERSARL